MYINMIIYIDIDIYSGQYNEYKQIFRYITTYYNPMLGFKEKIHCTRECR